MAFTRGLEHDRALYVANADGTEAAVIRGRGGMPFRPIWSPDGTHIAFLVVSADALHYSIVVVDCPPDRTRSKFGPRPRRLADLQLVGGRQQDPLPVPDDQGRPSLWGVTTDDAYSGCSLTAPLSAPGTADDKDPSLAPGRASSSSLAGQRGSAVDEGGTSDTPD